MLEYQRHEYGPWTRYRDRKGNEVRYGAIIYSNIIYFEDRLTTFYVNPYKCIIVVYVRAWVFMCVCGQQVSAYTA